MTGSCRARQYDLALWCSVKGTGPERQSASSRKGGVSGVSHSLGHKEVKTGGSEEAGSQLSLVS